MVSLILSTDQRFTAVESQLVDPQLAAEARQLIEERFAAEAIRLVDPRLAPAARHIMDAYLAAEATRLVDAQLAAVLEAKPSEAFDWAELAMLTTVDDVAEVNDYQQRCASPDSLVNSQVSEESVWDDLEVVPANEHSLSCVYPPNMTRFRCTMPTIQNSGGTAGSWTVMYQ